MFFIEQMHFVFIFDFEINYNVLRFKIINSLVFIFDKFGLFNKNEFVTL